MAPPAHDVAAVASLAPEHVMEEEVMEATRPPEHAAEEVALVQMLAGRAAESEQARLNALAAIPPLVPPASAQGLVVLAPAPAPAPVPVPVPVPFPFPLPSSGANGVMAGGVAFESALPAYIAPHTISVAVPPPFMPIAVAVVAHQGGPSAWPSANDSRALAYN